jgi:hypothetical protein
MGRRITFAEVIEAAASTYGVAVEQLQDKADRKEAVRVARARAILVGRRLRISCAIMGEALGGRTSSTIVNVHRRAEAAYEADPAERLAVAFLLDFLGLAELPPYEWTACAKGRLEPLERLIADTEAKLHRLHLRRAQLLRKAA